MIRAIVPRGLDETVPNFRDDCWDLTFSKIELRVFDIPWIVGVNDVVWLDLKSFILKWEF